MLTGPCPISLPLQRHEYPTRIHQIEAEDELDIDDLERFSQRTPLRMIQKYNGFHDGSRDSSLDDIKEEQEETFDSLSSCSRTLPVIRRSIGHSFLDDRSHYEEAKTVFSSTNKILCGKKKKGKEKKENLTTVEEDDGTDNRSPSPEIDYSSDESAESGISGIEGEHGFSLCTSDESGHMKRLSCGSSDSAMRDSDGGSSLCSDLEVTVTTAEINLVHSEHEFNKKPSDEMSGYESSLSSSRILPDSDEAAVFSFGESTEDGCSERGSFKAFPLPGRPPWKSKGFSHMQLKARKFSSSSEEDGGVSFPSFLHFKKETKDAQSSKDQEEEHLYSEIVPLSEHESDVEITQAATTHKSSKQAVDVCHSVSPVSQNLGLISGSLADILKHSITNGTFQRAGRGIPPVHNTCNPVFSSENIIKDPSTLERRKNETSTRKVLLSEKAVHTNKKEIHERSDSDEGIGSHDDRSKQAEFKFDETHECEPKKRGLKIKELQQILIKKDLPFANPALIFGFQAKKEETKEPRKSPVVIPGASRSRSNSCSDSDSEITLKPSSIVRPKRSVPPFTNLPATSAVTSTPHAPPAPPLPPPSTLPKANRSVTTASTQRLATRRDEDGFEKTYATTMKLNEKKDDLCFDEETRARISSIKAMLQRATTADKPVGTFPRKIPSVS